MSAALRPRTSAPHRLDDQRLAARVGSGDAAAFEALYDRHHRALLAFCRHMLGNREDGEDALQQTFLRAHKALLNGPVPDQVRSWLFAIARNRCLTMLSARKEAAGQADELAIAYDGLNEEVARRADLRELVAGLAELPEDQRGALVLAELGDLSHAEIAVALGCPAAKVKALIFQARTTLIADRDARSTACETIREQLAVASGGVLRRGPLRRHLRQCAPCDAFRIAVAGQRAGLRSILPVAPAIGLKGAVLAGAGLSGGEAAAAAAGGLGAAGGSGVAGGSAAGGMTGGSAAGALAAGGGVAIKAVAAKVAIVAVTAGAGVSGGVAAVNTGDEPRVAPAVAAATAEPTQKPRRTVTGAAVRQASTVTQGSPAGAPLAARPLAARRRALRRQALLRRARRAGVLRQVRLRRARRAAIGSGLPRPRAVARRRAARRRAALAAPPVTGTAPAPRRIRRIRQRRRIEQQSQSAPAAGTPVPRPRPRRDRPRRPPPVVPPAPTTTPAPTATPTATATPAPTASPAAPTATPTP